MENSKKHIIIIAGEASGDMHAAKLVNEIKKIDPSISFSGLGGSNMEASGVKLYCNLTKLAIVGFYEVLKHYKEIRQIFYSTLDKIKEVKPSAVILVDYPGFNLRLAKEIKKLGIKVIYYVSPQIWAWKKNRVYSIKKNVDKMLVFFAFEKDLYDKYDVNADFVGHPLIDIVKTTKSKEEFVNDNKLDNDKLTIGILPGSRKKEIETLLPIMLNSAKILSQKYNNIQFIISKAPTIDRSLIDEHLDDSINATIVEQDYYNAIKACDVCMVTSGTATLETTILEKPMVIVYKTSLITWLLIMSFVKIRYVGLANIIAGKEIIPECIQFNAKADIIAKRLEEIFTNESKMSSIKSELKLVKEYIGSSGASQNAAKSVMRVLQL
ncbi:MAG: lipid-A-disaccharide synthase [Candidatus Zapsychrus exili]|nr:lipid-A-disaccharide synthase [Candidatus Zapsychrus exili]